MMAKWEELCVFHGGSGFVTTKTQQKPTSGEEPFISTKGLERLGWNWFRLVSACESPHKERSARMCVCVCTCVR